MTRNLKIFGLALSALLLFAPVASAGAGHGGGGGGSHGGGFGGGGFHGGGSVGGGFHGGGGGGGGFRGGGSNGSGFRGGGARGGGFRDRGFHDRGFDGRGFRDRDRGVFFDDDFFFGAGFFGPWYGFDDFGFYDPYGYGYVPDGEVGQVKIQNSAKDTQVYVDGGYSGTVKQLGKFPLNAGTHDLELRSTDGRSLYKVRLDVIAGKTINIRP